MGKYEKLIVIGGWIVDEKTKWEVDQLKEAVKKHDTRIKDVEDFKISTIEKLKTIFERLKEIEKSNKWVSQSFFYILFSGVLAAVLSFVGSLMR